MTPTACRRCCMRSRRCISCWHSAFSSSASRPISVRWNRSRRRGTVKPRPLPARPKARPDFPSLLNFFLPSQPFEAIVKQDKHADQTLLILGDTNIQNRPDPSSAFVNVQDMLASADVIFGQLEGPLAEPSANPSQPDIPHKNGWRPSGAKVGPALKNAGYVGVSCASNVAYPATAAVASVKVLDEVGVLHCGVGETLAEARKPVIIEKNGIRLGFLSYTSVFWPSNHAASASGPGC